MFERIKAILSDDTAFYGMLLVLIAVASFGLGRWSMVDQSDTTQNASIIMAESPAPAVESTTTEGAEARAGTQQGSVLGTFVGSKNSDKYHFPWCPGAQRIKEANKVWFENEDAATAAGYVPAANCEGL